MFFLNKIIIFFHIFYIDITLSISHSNKTKLKHFCARRYCMCYFIYLVLLQIILHILKHICYDKDIYILKVIDLQNIVDI